MTNTLRHLYSGSHRVLMHGTCSVARLGSLSAGPPYGFSESGRDGGEEWGSEGINHPALVVQDSEFRGSWFGPVCGPENHSGDGFAAKELVDCWFLGNAIQLHAGEASRTARVGRAGQGTPLRKRPLPLLGCIMCGGGNFDSVYLRPTLSSVLPRTPRTPSPLCFLHNPPSPLLQTSALVPRPLPLVLCWRYIPLIVHQSPGSRQGSLP
jgi:hypothetical protein